MKNKKHGKRYNDEFRKVIIKLHNAGQSVKDLSNEYGVSEVTIYNWI